ncbi:MAG: hypothetical protein K2X39_01170 [Silvanigrellaceae bacterium]|nr:hypothetical protein [Silvanigrellaceae bacterium]
MNYKITQHYARSEEKLIAEINELNEAILFITKKSSVDDEERKKVIYRLYNDNELLQELNKENISITHANFAEDNSDFNNAAPFLFQVVIKAARSLDLKTIAQFNDKKDAILFIAGQFEGENRAHDNDLFFIYKDSVLIDTVNKTIILSQKALSSSNEKESTATLSPLSTRPTPGGGPPDYWVEKD